MTPVERARAIAMAQWTMNAWWEGPLPTCVACGATLGRYQRRFCSHRCAARLSLLEHDYRVYWQAQGLLSTTFRGHRTTRRAA